MANLEVELEKDEPKIVGEALEDEASLPKRARVNSVEKPLMTDEVALLKKRGPLKSEYYCSTRETSVVIFGKPHVVKQTLGKR